MNTTELNGKTYQLFGEAADGTITLKPVIPKPRYRCGDVYGDSEGFGVRDNNGTHDGKSWMHTAEDGIFIFRSDSDASKTGEEIKFNVFDVLDGSYKRECIREFRNKISAILLERDSFDDSLWDQMFHSSVGLSPANEAKAHAKLCELLDICDDDYEPEPLRSTYG